MKCPECGHDMGKSSKCLRCGYTVRAIVPIEPEKIEQEAKADKEPTKVIRADEVRVSRGTGGGLFDSIFGGIDSIFGGGLGSLFDSIFGGFSLFGEDEDAGYEYDPKYYDDFGNEIDLPDEFERDSVEISAVEFMEEDSKESKGKRKKKDGDGK